MKELLFFTTLALRACACVGALIGALLAIVLLTWLLPDDAVRGCKPVQPG